MFCHGLNPEFAGLYCAYVHICTYCAGLSSVYVYTAGQRKGGEKMGIKL